MSDHSSNEVTLRVGDLIQVKDQLYSDTPHVFLGEDDEKSGVYSSAPVVLNNNEEFTFASAPGSFNLDELKVDSDFDPDERLSFEEIESAFRNYFGGEMNDEYKRKFREQYDTLALKIRRRE